ncbi:hypothetical protein E4V51_13595 [Paenibacillus sp. 28ISP30-2]|uniref:hypothetical protein n=1 Tax=Paenibacillus polymyxa TaxID=1406 RepID=UPI0004720D41|nr:hypothetical protein [Paenibacillus polymyxa]MBE0342005.1 hypothetical protein [Paenibacillus sp. 28ISP30-2]
MKSPHYYTSQEVQQLLGLGSLRTAQIRIQSMNEELKSRGYWIERGKVPRKFFHERYPYIPEERISS